MGNAVCVYAVWIETGGKQRYIFGTNKLREIVGASQIVALSTQDWVDHAVERADSRDDVAVEQVVRASGLTLLTVLAEDDETARHAARELLTDVTATAAELAPGLVVTGGLLRADDLSPATRRKLIAEAAQARAALPSAEARLARLPVVASCRTGDGPAAQYFDDASGDGFEPLSAASIQKRRHNDWGRFTTRRIVDGENPPERSRLVQPRDWERSLAGDVRWVGVVHADGNRIGALVGADIDQDAYRAFSTALDTVTHEALREAVTAATALRNALFPGVPKDDPVAVLPLVASGDDLTAFVDGWLALPFTLAYLRAFERLTAGDERLTAVVQHVYGRPGGITAAAGVAIVKPHFPFPRAYALCEDACDSAKSLSASGTGAAPDQPVPPVSAIDWHVHYDSTGARLGEVRKRPYAGSSGRLRLTRRPYAVVAEGGTLPEGLRGRDIAALERLVRDVPVARHPDSVDALPLSQLWQLRKQVLKAAATGDRCEAERTFRQLSNRQELALLHCLGAVPGPGSPPGTRSLFAPWDGDEADQATVLLDYLDLVSEDLLSSAEPLDAAAAGAR